MLDMADFSLFEEEISKIYAELETNLLAYVVHMIQTGDLPADPNTWAVRKLDHMMNLRGQLRREISRLVQGSTADLEKEVERMVRLSAGEDNQYFRDIARFATSSVADGIRTASESEIARRVRAIMRNCRESINLTGTSALEAAISTYRDAINSAYVSVLEGTQSLDTAIRKACRQIGSSGLKLTYISENGNPSTISLDAGIRRNIVTSVNQATAEYTMEDCAQNGCDLVQTSAHAGARPSHQVWQGKVFSISGNSKKYGKLETETGYGTAGGLCGINCKHSFFPYYEGMQKTDWHIDLTPRQNEELYDDIQKQRSYEARIRSWKRRQVLAKDTGDVAEYAKATACLKATRKELRGFLEDTGLPRRLNREQI